MSGSCYNGGGVPTSRLQKGFPLLEGQQVSDKTRQVNDIMTLHRCHDIMTLAVVMTHKPTFETEMTKCVFV